MVHRMVLGTSPGREIAHFPTAACCNNQLISNLDIERYWLQLPLWYGICWDKSCPSTATKVHLEMMRRSACTYLWCEALGHEILPQRNIYLHRVKLLEWRLWVFIYVKNKYLDRYFRVDHFTRVANSSFIFTFHTTLPPCPWRRWRTQATGSYY